MVTGSSDGFKDSTFITDDLLSTIFSKRLLSFSLSFSEITASLFSPLSISLSIISASTLLICILSSFCSR